MLAEAAAGASVNGYAGLVLTGGGDVSPALYGEEAAAETDPPDVERDTVESELIDQSLDRDLPLFAICRGLQILNVHLGGSLIQHLDTTARHQSRVPDHSLPTHDVSIEPGTLLASIAHSNRWPVNSRHHQAVGRPGGGGLRVCARDAEDGTIEAMEIPGRQFVLGVQWHPEDQALTDRRQLDLFRAFAAAL